MLHDYVRSALLLVVYVVGAAALFTLLWRGYARKSTCRKVGISIAAAGLVFQACQLVVMLLAGALPHYIDVPLWALKDVGLFMCGFGIAKRDMWRKPSDCYYYLKEEL